MCPHVTVSALFAGLTARPRDAGGGLCGHGGRFLARLPPLPPDLTCQTETSALHRGVMTETDAGN